MTKALVPLAEGVEEMEAVIVIDTFRRAGWNVVAAGFDSGPVKASRGVLLHSDAQWKDVDPDAFEILVIPGGRGGTDRLCRHSEVLEAVRRFHAGGKRVAAVCAGPLVLKEAGILDGRRITCHPSVEEEMKPIPRIDQPVVIDGNIITSQGAGTTFDFALNIIEQVDGPGTAQQIADALVLRRIPLHF